jgi:hypothetical protein
VDRDGVTDLGGQARLRRVQYPSHCPAITRSNADVAAGYDTEGPIEALDLWGHLDRATRAQCPEHSDVEKYAIKSHDAHSQRMHFSTFSGWK